MLPRMSGRERSHKDRRGGRTIEDRGSKENPSYLCPHPACREAPMKETSPSSPISVALLLSFIGYHQVLLKQKPCDPFRDDPVTERIGMDIESSIVIKWFADPS